MIYFEKKNDDVTSQDLCAQLKDLKIWDNFLNVEPDKRSGASSGTISKDDESTTDQDSTKNEDIEVKN